MVFASLPGTLSYGSRINPDAVDLDQLKSGISEVLSQDELRQAVNAELAYTASLEVYLSDADVRTRSLLALLSDRYGR